MAEYVQQTIEEMTNEVLQMERVGLFEHSEIKKIINKRKRYEYKLRRRVKTKEDFLSYIEYEVNVLSLLAVRRKQDGYVHKKGEIEGAILKRVLTLYHIACRNWPQAQDLWMARIKFVQTKMKNKSLVSSLFTRLLQVITNQPHLWLMAAKYEFDTVYSIESARHVLLKGISLNKQSTLLWHEYFRLELLFVDFVMRREKLLKTGLLSQVPIPKYIEDGTLRDEVREGKVACTVYSHARQALPGDYEFAVGFVPVIKQFAWTSDIEEFIFTDLFEAFSDRAELWEVKADRYIDTVQADSPDFAACFGRVESKCSKLLRRMIKADDSERSWSTYLSVNYKLLNLSRTEEAVSKFYLLLSLVEQKGLLTEHWLLQWVRLLASEGKVKDALLCYEKAVERFPKSEPVWTSYIEYVCKANPENITPAVNVFHRARKSLKQESVALWQLIIQLCTGVLGSEALTALYELAVAAHSSIAGTMKESYLHWVYLTQGMRKARQLYKRLRQSISVTVDFYKMYIEMENCESTLDMNRMRKAYRHMLHDFGETSVEAWLEIIALEKAAGDVGKMSVLYSQAIRCLKGDLVQEFIHKQALHASAGSSA